MAGSFQRDAVFQDEQLTSRGDTDIFIAKYDESGQIAWVRSAGGSTKSINSITEYASALALSEEHVYVTGVFSGVALFDGQVVTSSGGDDVFLAKYTLDGALVWVKSAGGSSQDISYDLVVDSENHIYMTGSFQKKAFFDQTEVWSVNNSEAFIAKYSPDGNLLWVKQSESSSHSAGKALSIYKDQVFVTGDFTQEIKFGEESISSKGSSDGFVLSYRQDGQMQDLIRVGDEGKERINDLVVDDDGILVLGSFFSSSQTNLWANQGLADVFIERIDLGGNSMWTKTFGSKGMDAGSSMVVDHSSILVTGSFFDELTIEDNTYFSQGASDIFLIGLNAKGELEQLETFGGTGQDIPKQLLVNKQHILLTGFYHSQIGTEETSFGNSDVFLASIDQSKFEEHAKVASYLVYPNPTNHVVHVSANEVFDEVIIISPSGMIMDKWEDVNSTTFSADIHTYPSGIYYIKIDDKRVKKLVLVK